MAEDWSKSEVRLIVKDYFEMLQLELSNRSYNKTEHRRSLMPRLDDRSSGSIEFKHQNISAALVNMGLPFIKGYKPRFNYQKELLEKEIAEYIKSLQLHLENQFKEFADKEVFYKRPESPAQYIVDEEPVLSNPPENDPLYRPVRINYLEREQNNRALGEKGEEFVIRYEKFRLANEGKEHLADKIEWVSKEVGDGLGYDILSKNKNGTDRYIEVKTTKLSRETPIYLSKAEISFATQNAKEFYLYRVFDFAQHPKMFIRNGLYEGFCKLIPQTFRGYFKN